MIYITYGSANNNIDITDYIKNNCLYNNKITLNKGNKQFNTLFGDPAPGVYKNLQIQAKHNYKIGENELDEIVIDLNADNYAYYNYLFNNIKTINRAKQVLQSKDNRYYDLTILNDREITTSIVMTTYNRSLQTYYSLKTIQNCGFKDVQVIIVDDSTTDLLDFDKLKEFDLCIYHIKTKNKFWFNPCINYNLGFQFIKGNNIIIQNAEVCYVGNVIDYITKNLADDIYLVFDVANLPNIEANTQLQTTGKINYTSWYQHYNLNNRHLHFLTAITRQTFNKLEGFDCDFCMGSWYDDDELVFRIRANKIKIVEVKNDIENIMGIHQWHTPSGNDWDKNVMRNNELLDAKKRYFNKNSKLKFVNNYSDCAELFGLNTSS